MRLATQAQNEGASACRDVLLTRKLVFYFCVLSTLLQESIEQVEHISEGTLMSPVTTSFSFQSTASEIIEGIHLTGKRAVVAGGASGIGIETARALAGAGASVTLAVGRPQGSGSLAAELRQSTGNDAIDIVTLDLGDLRSVRAFADFWKGPLHILVRSSPARVEGRRRPLGDVRHSMGPRGPGWHRHRVALNRSEAKQTEVCRWSIQVGGSACSRLQKRTKDVQARW